eukprot:5429-Eustigmatos_ZCMA.PRE.1
MVGAFNHSYSHGMAGLVLADISHSNILYWYLKSLLQCAEVVVARQWVSSSSQQTMRIHQP